MSKTSEPIATTDTSGSPNTNTPFTFWTLSGEGKGERTLEAGKQTVPPVCVCASASGLSVSLCFDPACRADDLLGGVYVSALPHVHHGRPAGGDDSSGPGAGHGRRGVDAPLPVWSHEVLIVTVLFIAVQDHRGTFGGVAVLQRNVAHT